MLLFLLTIPAFIIVFLNLFGTNSFTIPPVDPFANFEKLGIDDPALVGCNQPLANESVKVPAYLSNALSASAYKVVRFAPYPCETDECLTSFQQLVRVHDKFTGKEAVDFFIFSLSDAETTDWGAFRQKYYLPESWYFISVQWNEELAEMANCGLYLGNSKEENSFKTDLVALLNEQNQLKGIYKLADKEEMDRLSTEIKILLSEKPR